MDTRCASPVSHQSHITRITSKIGNVFLDPMQSSDLVQDAQIGWMATFAIGIGVKEACKRVSNQWLIMACNAVAPRRSAQWVGR